MTNQDRREEDDMAVYAAIEALRPECRDVSLARIAAIVPIGKPAVKRSLQRLRNDGRVHYVYYGHRVGWTQGSK